MAQEFDKEFYRKDKDGNRVFNYVIRPSIHNNNLGPIPLGRNIRINILRNNEQVVLFQYDVVKQIPQGKKLMASAIFELKEQNASDQFNPMGQTIVCLDTQIEQKVGQEYQLAYIERPRNVRRSNLGPFVVGDVIRVEFLMNGNVVDSFDYSPSSALPVGKVLMGLGRVDFVQCA